MLTGGIQKLSPHPTEFCKRLKGVSDPPDLADGDCVLGQGLCRPSDLVGVVAVHEPAGVGVVDQPSGEYLLPDAQHVDPAVLMFRARGVDEDQRPVRKRRLHCLAAHPDDPAQVGLEPVLTHPGVREPVPPLEHSVGTGGAGAHRRVDLVDADVVRAFGVESLGMARLEVPDPGGLGLQLGDDFLHRSRVFDPVHEVLDRRAECVGQRDRSSQRCSRLADLDHGDLAVGGAGHRGQLPLGQPMPLAQSSESISVHPHSLFVSLTFRSCWLYHHFSSVRGHPVTRTRERSAPSSRRVNGTRRVVEYLRWSPPLLGRPVVSRERHPSNGVRPASLRGGLESSSRAVVCARGRSFRLVPYPTAFFPHFRSCRISAAAAWRRSAYACTAVPDCGRGGFRLSAWACSAGEGFVEISGFVLNLGQVRSSGREVGALRARRVGRLLTRTRTRVVGVVRMSRCRSS